VSEKTLNPLSDETLISRRLAHYRGKIETLNEHVRLLKKFIEETPCDPDTTDEQCKAYMELRGFEKRYV